MFLMCWHAFDMFAMFRRALACLGVMFNVFDTLLIRSWYLLFSFDSFLMFSFVDARFPRHSARQNILLRNLGHGTVEPLFNLNDTCLCRDSQCQCHGPMA